MKLPLISLKVFTENPPCLLKDAVNEPVNILLKSKSKIASFGISNKSLPDPENDADISGTSIDSLTNTLPLNSERTEPVDSTINVPLSLREAVTDPVAIKFDINASGAKAERGISNSFSPLPLNTLPLAN